MPPPQQQSQCPQSPEETPEQGQLRSAVGETVSVELSPDKRAADSTAIFADPSNMIEQDKASRGRDHTDIASAAQQIIGEEEDDTEFLRENEQGRKYEGKEENVEVEEKRDKEEVREEGQQQHQKQRVQDDVEGEQEEEYQTTEDDNITSLPMPVAPPPPHPLNGDADEKEDKKISSRQPANDDAKDATTRRLEAELNTALTALKSAREELRLEKDR